MGKKGARLTRTAIEAADSFLEQWSSLGDLTSKKMFGGVGLFEGGKMFALLTSAGDLHLKIGDANRQELEAAGSEPFGKMPYGSVPDTVLADRKLLERWVSQAISITHSG